MSARGVKNDRGECLTGREMSVAEADILVYMIVFCLYLCAEITLSGHAVIFGGVKPGRLLTGALNRQRD